MFKRHSTRSTVPLAVLTAAMILLVPALGSGLVYTGTIAPAAPAEKAATHDAGGVTCLEFPVATFSIVGCDPETGELGVAVQSKFFAVGAVVPWAKAKAGAIATQAFGNTTYGPKGLELLAAGKTPSEVIEALTSADDGKDRRQVGMVDARGNAATYTGKGCNAWAGGRTGKYYAAQGNILVGEPVLDAMCQAFETTRGELADRLLAALVAGQAAGGDSRGQQSAALVVVKEGGGYGGFNDRYIDLRVDDHPEPIKELGRLLEIQHYISKILQAYNLSREGKHEEAVAAARKAVEYKPDAGEAHYDLACFLSLGGRTEESLTSLETALKLSPKLASLAETDADFENVRPDARFGKLLATAKTVLEGAEKEKTGEEKPGKK
ncbi:MAG: DUF1028 domain-containing protein [Candidatus Eisenbacteria bacterium]